MTTAVPSTALATIQPACTDPERLALAGFLAGYRGLTREAYALDLRQFTTWCRARSLTLLPDPARCALAAAASGRGDGGRLSDAVNRYRIAGPGQAGGEPRRGPSSWARSGVVIGSSSTILPPARR